MSPLMSQKDAGARIADRQRLARDWMLVAACGVAVVIGVVGLAALAGCELPPRAPGTPIGGLAPGHPDAAPASKTGSAAGGQAGSAQPTRVEPMITEGAKPGPGEASLPSLAQEQQAKKARDTQKNKKSGLPSLDEERRAQQVRTGTKPTTGTAPSAPVTPAPAGDGGGAVAPTAPAPVIPAPVTPTPAPTPAPAPAPTPAPAPAPTPAAPASGSTADTYVPAWWIDKATEANGVMSVAARGEGSTLLEARRAAIEQATRDLRTVLGAEATVSEAPVNSTAVRLSSGQFRAFVMMAGHR